MTYLKHYSFVVILAVLITLNAPPLSGNDSLKKLIYNPGKLKPIDSSSKLKLGDPAPKFTLPGINGKKVSLKDFFGKKNVVISFVPAAWTPVCSQQWPGYNISEDLFKDNDAILLGITVDNIPTLSAWTKQMGSLWFPVLSDFYPHGQVAKSFGILRTNGVSERATFLIDKQGIIRYININDINKRPPMDNLIKALINVQKK